MINKVILVGNVGKDPEIRYVEKNVPVARFSLATSERAFVNAKGVQVPERTEWHNIVVWRSLAEVVEKYVRKGTQLYIEGKITYNQWVDKSNVSHSSTEIIADTLQLLGKRPDEEPAPLKTITYQESSSEMDNLPLAGKDDINDEGI